MQINRANQFNQQTNFKSIYSEVRPNQWKDLITNQVYSTEQIRTLLSGSTYKTGVVLDGIGLLSDVKRAFKYADKARMILTDGHSTEFNKATEAAQRSYLSAYLPFTYGKNGGDSLILVVDAKRLVG